MPEFDPLCFANRKEVHRIKINEPYLLKVEYESLPAAIDLFLQFLHLLRFNSPAEL
jgi:hypothetical protein